MTTTYLAGLVLGLGLILPIGAQNVFILNQGLHAGLPRALWAVLGAGTCDTILIMCGAAGASAALTAVPGLRPAMLAAGSLFLVIMAIRSMRSAPSELLADNGERSGRQMLVNTAAVSLLNPHAVLDTVGVLGAVITAQTAANRIPFAVGVISASWIWFVVLAVGGSLLRGATGPAIRVWFDRISGVVLLAFAGILAREFLVMAI